MRTGKGAQRTRIGCDQRKATSFLEIGRKTEQRVQMDFKKLFGKEEMREFPN